MDDFPCLWKSAKLLRTHPPQGLPGVAGMEFSGAQPFTRLRPRDPSLSDAAELAMFGRSRWRVGDMEASATPAVGFTLTARNPSETAPLELMRTRMQADALIRKVQAEAAARSREVREVSGL